MNDEKGAFRRTKPGAGARARETSPKKLKLQERAYELHMHFATDQKIADELGICRGVASEYWRAEWARRREECQDDRELEIRRQVALCEDEIRWQRERRETPQATGRESQYILMASERIAKLRGLDSPMRIRDETPAPTPFAGEPNAVNVTKLLRLAIAAKPTPELAALQRNEDD